MKVPALLLSVSLVFACEISASPSAPASPPASGASATAAATPAPAAATPTPAAPAAPAAAAAPTPPATPQYTQGWVWELMALGPADELTHVPLDGYGSWTASLPFRVGTAQKRDAALSDYASSSYRGEAYFHAEQSGRHVFVADLRFPPFTIPQPVDCVFQLWIEGQLVLNSDVVSVYGNASMVRKTALGGADLSPGFYRATSWVACRGRSNLSVPNVLVDVLVREPGTPSARSMPARWVHERR